MEAQRYLAPFGHAFDLKMGRIRGIKGDTYLGSTSGKAVLYFLTRPPIWAFRLGEDWETGCTDTF
jgi:hypothetical protein